MIAAGWAVPSFIAETARILDLGDPATRTAHAAGRKVLVLVQFAGGNDGLNTLIPHGDATYYAPNVRPGLAIPRSSVLQLNDDVRLHPPLLPRPRRRNATLVPRLASRRRVARPARCWSH